jgi:hypothetical protein
MAINRKNWNGFLDAGDGRLPVVGEDRQSRQGDAWRGMAHAGGRSFLSVCPCVCPFVSVWHTVRACDRDGNAVIGLLYCYFWSPGQRSTMAFVTVSCHPRLITAGKSESVAKNHRSHRPGTCRLHAALLSSRPARPRWLCPLGRQRNHTQSLIKMTQISRENGERHGALNPKPSWLEPAAS